MQSPSLDYVVNGLDRHKGDWPQIAVETGVPYDTLSKIARRAIHDPGVRKIDAIAANLRMRDAQAVERKDAGVEGARGDSVEAAA